VTKLLDRIEYKVTKGGCWECTSHRARAAGYPYFKAEGKNILGHRLVYMEEKGPIPEGLLVRHTCDNRKCLNPKHLLLGTYKDNFQDMVDRGDISHLRTGNKGKTLFSARGSKNHRAKLNEEKVRTIRQLLKDGAGVRELGVKFNVSHVSISKIKHRKSWNWLK